MSYHSAGDASYSIDYFHGRHCAYFLTHIHTDHLCGLHNGWKNGKIYCSEQTKQLLLSMFELNINLIVSFPLDYPNILKLRESYVTVTFVDANHCPGSIMVKICGDFGCRLHSGDFRFDYDLHQRQIFKGINFLFLDTTFFHPSWRMPTKVQSCEAVIDLILRKGQTRLVYIAADCYGQEDILLAIHRRFGEPVVLDIAHAGISRRTRAVWSNWLNNVPCLQSAVTENTKSPSRFRACAANGKGVSKLNRENALNIFSLAKREVESNLLIRASTLWFGSRDRFESCERVERSLFLSIYVCLSVL